MRLRKEVEEEVKVARQYNDTVLAGIHALKKARVKLADRCTK